MVKKNFSDDSFDKIFDISKTIISFELTSLVLCAIVSTDPGATPGLSGEVPHIS